MVYCVQMNAAVRAKTQQPSTAGVDTSVKLLDSATERSISAYVTLNKFFQNFIDHVRFFVFFYILVSE